MQKYDLFLSFACVKLSISVTNVWLFVAVDDQNIWMSASVSVRTASRQTYNPKTYKQMNVSEFLVLYSRIIKSQDSLHETAYTCTRSFPWKYIRLVTHSEGLRNKQDEQCCIFFPFSWHWLCTTQPTPTARTLHRSKYQCSETWTHLYWMTPTMWSPFQNHSLQVLLSSQPSQHQMLMG